MEKTLSQIAEDRVHIARATSRFFTGLACAFLALNFLFILTLYQMGNRLQILAQLFVFLQSSKNLVLPEALKGTVSMRDFLNEVIIRDFIMNRHSFVRDEEEMMRRWGPGGPVSRVLAPKLYRDFVGPQKQLKTSIKKDTQSLPNVGVDIRKVTHTKDGFNWTVEFDIITEENETKTETYIASLRVGNYPVLVYYSPTFNNPIGLGVSEYSFFPKKTEEQ